MRWGLACGTGASSVSYRHSFLVCIFCNPVCVLGMYIHLRLFVKKEESDQIAKIRRLIRAIPVPK